MLKIVSIGRKKFFTRLAERCPPGLNRSLKQLIISNLSLDLRFQQLFLSNWNELVRQNREHRKKKFYTRVARRCHLAKPQPKAAHITRFKLIPADPRVSPVISLTERTYAKIIEHRKKSFTRVAERCHLA